MRRSIAYLGLGSNLGDRLGSLRDAVALLDEHTGIHVDFDHGVAPVYETQPFGVMTDQPWFLNTAIRVFTILTPHGLLDEALAVEKRLGRIGKGRGEARPIDIDVLFYTDVVIADPVLTIPHPRMHERRFVLEPLAEIAGDLVCPGLGCTIADLAQQLRSPTEHQRVEIFASRDWLTPLVRPDGAHTPSAFSDFV